jgi:lysine/ornithine N-monooxygenase
MSTLKVSTLQNLSGTEVYTCKAWVNFNGTGTVAIRASGNVSSITDNGTGDYTINFTTAMSDANYSTQICASSNANAGISMYYIISYAASNVRVSSGYQPYSPAAFQDCPTVNVVVNR